MSEPIFQIYETDLETLERELSAALREATAMLEIMANLSHHLSNISDDDSPLRFPEVLREHVAHHAQNVKSARDTIRKLKELDEAMAKAKELQKRKCDHCGGLGKVPHGVCNCGTGEGCSQHDVWMWGKKCPVCNGTGYSPTHHQC